MVIKTYSVGDYDRSVVILTKDKGKITAYAKGARKPTSKYLAATNPFVFGEFKLFVGKTSYNIIDVSISNYFDLLRNDFTAAYYGMYFLEVVDYVTRENNDEKEVLKLLYQSLKALSNENFSYKLVQIIFNLKIVMINGEYPGTPKEMTFHESTLYALQYIYQSPVEKLFTFQVLPQILKELEIVAKYCMKSSINKKFNSLMILETIEQDNLQQNL